MHYHANIWTLWSINTEVVNSIDQTWYRNTFTCVNIVLTDPKVENVYKSKTQEVKSSTKRQDRIKAQILVRLLKNSAALRIPESTVALIVLTKKMVRTKILPRACCLTKLSSQEKQSYATFSKESKWSESDLLIRLFEKYVLSNCRLRPAGAVQDIAHK